MASIWDKVKDAPDGATEVEIEVESPSSEYLPKKTYDYDDYRRERTAQRNTPSWQFRENHGDRDFIDSVNMEKQYRKAQKDQEDMEKEEDYKAAVEDEKRYLETKEVRPLPNDYRVDDNIPNVFSPKTQKWIDDFSNSFDVHPSVAMALLFGVASIACQGKFKVVRHGNHSELVTLYVLVTMPSGKLKSPMMEAALAPVVELEKELRISSASEISKSKTARKIYTDMIKAEEKKAIKTGAVEVAAETICEIEQKMPPVMFPPKLVLFKFTPEGLESHMHEQGGSIALAGAELGSLKKISADKDDLMLQGWAGESYSYRKRDEEITISNPCLSMLFATQERTSEKLLGKQALCEDGLVSRFTCLVPPDVRRKFGAVTTDEIPQESRDWFRTLVRKIHGIKRHETGWHNFSMPRGGIGQREWDAFYAHTQMIASSDSTPDVLKSYYRKLAGTALRFAGLLHLIEAVGNGTNPDHELSDDSILSGIDIADFFAQHAEVALDISANNSLELAHRVVEHISDHAGEEIKVRDIYRALHVTKDVIEPALFLLERNNYLSLLKFKTSVRCVVNPRLRRRHCR
ncbi:DUF3987 domain-containing protein [Marinifilum sp. JC120]|nr:DUF3987 domain-containing protein [Marinifilum sp. JC120]